MWTGWLRQPPNKRRSLLLADIQSKVTRALGLDASTEMDRRQPLSEMGLDSLMAVELRNALGYGTGPAFARDFAL